MDDNTSTGIFLHHTGSTSISKYLDVNTNREKTTAHLDYDEAHYTASEKPLGAQALINNGYGTKDRQPTLILPTEVDSNIDLHGPNKLYVKKLNPNAILQSKQLTEQLASTSSVQKHVLFNQGKYS